MNNRFLTIVQNRITGRVKKGFTLAELVISIGILGLVLTLTAGVLVSVVRSYARQRVIAEIERNGDFVTRVLYEKMRIASEVECYPSPANCPEMPPGTTTSSYIRILNFDGNAEYIGVAEPAAATCGTDRNNFIFSTTDDPEDPDTIIDPMVNSMTNYLPNGVQIESFEAETFIPPVGPQSINLKIGIKQSICETLFADSPESKSFDIFVTVRSTYK